MARLHRRIRSLASARTWQKAAGTAIMAAILCSNISCSDGGDDGYVYPSLLTEFAELYTNSGGQGFLFTTDGGQTYAIRTPVEGLQAGVAYRVICGFEPTAEQNGPYPVAILYRMESVTLLRSDEETDDADDPTALTAIWRGADYLNLQLTPRTQGGEHQWGYRTDSVTVRADGRKTLHLSLCHRQGDDPPSYSTTVYASLPLYELELQKGDSITFTIPTFDGKRTYGSAY